MNPSKEKEWTSPAQNTNSMSSPDDEQSLHQSPVVLAKSLCGNILENARESFEEVDMSTEEPSMFDVLYGEPLSREDSSSEQKIHSQEAEQKIPSEEPEQKIRSEEPEQKIRSKEPEQKIRSIEPEQKIRSIEPEQKIRSIEPEQKIRSKEPEQKIRSKEPEQKIRSIEPEQKKRSKEPEQKKYSFENEQTQSKENEQEMQEPPALTDKIIPRYKCNVCPAVFCHASGKYRHMKKHELFKLTGKMFKYRNSIFSIMSKPATSSSTTTDERTDNMKQAEANSSAAMTCNFCGKCFDTSQSLKKHERSHKSERPYRCQDCGKGFKKRAYLIGHKNVHQRRIQCTVCRKILPTIRELIQHRSSHLKRGMLKCPDCHMQFQFPAHLLRHVETHKKKENKATQLEEKTQRKPQQAWNSCPFCQHNFSNRRNLLRHMTRHTGQKPFSCSTCGKQFYRYIYLQLHSEHCLPSYHHGHKINSLLLLALKSSATKMFEFKCTHCTQRFRYRSLLLRHLVSHTGLQPYQHQRMHKSEFQCQACGRGFVSLFALRKHKHTHGKSRPYRCTKCHLSFTGPIQLAEHMSTHREENFPCDICNRVFLSKSRLQQLSKAGRCTENSLCWGCMK
uniref:C2H2-type domain-containing protein n=1 Tax=Mola mola TaxID=94237 RepID=A0A3Q4BGQ3_MOLML